MKNILTDAENIFLGFESGSICSPIKVHGSLILLIVAFFYIFEWKVLQIKCCLFLVDFFKK